MVNESQSEHRFRLVICLLLAVTTWRGPVPVLHDHLQAGHLSSRHSAVCHNGADLREVQGLHWHLAFPRDVSDLPSPDVPPTGPDLLALACARALELPVSPSQPVICSADVLSANGLYVMACDGLQSQRSCSPTAGTFLNTLLTRAPLSAVTGVCTI